MTILRLDLSAGGWRAVSPFLFEDDRLSLDARAVAGFIATRSDSFHLNVRGLCTLMGIGDDRWRRINGELTSAGYLKRIVGKDQRGRFRHELLFSPIPRDGYPEKRSRCAVVIHPENLDWPSTEEGKSVQPESVEPMTTIQGVNNIFEDHHHQNSQGGAHEKLKPVLPEAWTEAANFEIDVEQKARPIRNKDALFNAIVERYHATGGPTAAVFDSLDKRKNDQLKTEAQLELRRRKAELEFEQADVAKQNRASAESKAIFMTSEERHDLIIVAESKYGLRFKKAALEAFVQHGIIGPGPICHLLVQLLMRS